MERTIMVTAAVARETDTMETVKEMVATAGMAGTAAMGVAMGAAETVAVGMEAAAAVVGAAAVAAVEAKSFGPATRLYLQIERDCLSR